MLSLAHTEHYYQLYLTQGLLAGIGGGFLYLPAVAIQAHHWRERRALAMGVAITGKSYVTRRFPRLVVEVSLCRFLGGRHRVSDHAQPAHQRNGRRICVGSPRRGLPVSRAVGRCELAHDAISSCLPALGPSAEGEPEGYPQ